MEQSLLDPWWKSEELQLRSRYRSLKAVELKQLFTLFFQEVDGGPPRRPWMDISSNINIFLFLLCSCTGRETLPINQFVHPCNDFNDRLTHRGRSSSFASRAWRTRTCLWLSFPVSPLTYRGVKSKPTWNSKKINLKKNLNYKWSGENFFLEFATQILLLPLRWQQGGLCTSLLGVKQHLDPT